ncbi:MAG: peptidase S8 [Streptosporangiales bacterium]|nr:peptidase S8 [Streptosporangiales bacterium]
MTERRGGARRVAWLVVAALAVSLGVGGGAAPAEARPAAGFAAPRGIAPEQVCEAPAKRRAGCDATVVVDSAGRPLGRKSATAAGLRPFTAADLQDAYKLPSALLGARQTIAIVSAFDAPNAEADLAVYREVNGLPPCDADFPCFRKVDQRGGTAYPRPDQTWSTSSTIGLQMASAACPNCELLLVEADDNQLPNLGAAVDTAVELGADVVSNAYNAREYAGMLTDLGDHYVQPEAVVVAASGGAGFGATVPAALPSVVAVGGTTLYRDDSARGWGEEAWASAGSGCSAYIAKPDWQLDRLCGKRTVTDVAVVADGNTPVAVYVTYGYPGWVAAGGPSVAAPLVAGVYALAGNAGEITPGARLRAQRDRLFDVTSGSNGVCGGSYLCTAVRGYDGPTGWGTPNGVGAF